MGINVKEPGIERMRRAAAAQKSAQGQEPAEGESTSVRHVSPLYRPVVFRLPKGFVVVAVLGLIGLVVGAYAVGRQNGLREGIQQQKAIYQSQASGADAAEMPGNIVPHSRVPGTGASTGGTAPDVAIVTPTGTNSQVQLPGSSRANTGERRQVGLNYFVLQRYPEAEAQRLIAFLRQNGVESLAVATHNSQLQKVVALRGFPGKEIAGLEAQQYKKRLMQLGRAWKIANGGKGADLSDMYLELYKGE